MPLLRECVFHSNLKAFQTPTWESGAWVSPNIWPFLTLSYHSLPYLILSYLPYGTLWYLVLPCATLIPYGNRIRRFRCLGCPVPFELINSYCQSVSHIRNNSNAHLTLNLPLNTFTLVEQTVSIHRPFQSFSALAASTVHTLHASGGFQS